MLITEIRYERRKRKCLVLLDDERQFYFSTDIVIKFYIAKGKNIDDNFLSSIIEEQKKYDVKQSAMYYASYKPRTVWQVRDRLKQKGFDANEINFALEFLREFDFLDDKRYAKNFVKDYLLRKPVGKRKLIEELRKRGIETEIAECVIEEEFPEKDNYDLALKSAEKKFRSISNKEINKQRELLISHLQRQGFGWDIINSVIKVFIEKNDSTLNFKK